jgi:magnesium-transporting ATPase (P-type)
LSYALHPHLSETLNPNPACLRFLSRLLLVHGRSSYKRNSEIILYSFYKNWVMNLTYNIFAFASGKAMVKVSCGIPVQCLGVGIYGS